MSAASFGAILIDTEHVCSILRRTPVQLGAVRQMPDGSRSNRRLAYGHSYVAFEEVITGKRKRGRKRKSATLEADEPEPEPEPEPAPLKAPVARMYESAGCGGLLQEE
jgi:hypothetical protein